MEIRAVIAVATAVVTIIIAAAATIITVAVMVEDTARVIIIVAGTVEATVEAEEMVGVAAVVEIVEAEGMSSW
jgi:hypothetical protein